MAAYNLTNKVALVTGARSDIGRAVLVLIVQLGSKVAKIGRNVKKLQQAHSLCINVSSSHNASEFLIIKADLDQVDQIPGVLSRLSSRLSHCSSKADLDNDHKIFHTKHSAYPENLGVLVNAVAPRFIATDIHENVGIDEDTRRRMFEGVGSFYPLRRAGIPEEVAHAVAFLALSQKASLITGITLPVDGGMLCKRSSSEHSLNPSKYR
ncbi:hypothetical protein ACTXT7_001240 [Hymenolepis weldensis]